MSAVETVWHGPALVFSNISSALGGHLPASNQVAATPVGLGFDKGATIAYLTFLLGPSLKNIIHAEGVDPDLSSGLGYEPVYNPDGSKNDSSGRWYLDADHDGFAATSDYIEDAFQASLSYVRRYALVSTVVDCNDGNDKIFPGAPELQDNLDNDCDSLVDEDSPAWFRDSDSDGFGDPRQPSYAAGQPLGYVANDLDCDDSNSEINPSAKEVHDDYDNDCDGENNEGLTEWFVDNDNDGYGEDSTPSWSEAPIMGFVSNNDDCDDSSSRINPGAPELPDGLDNNCDGMVDEDLCQEPQAQDEGELPAGVRPPATTPPPTDNEATRPPATVPESCVQWFLDEDNDGFGTPGNSSYAVSKPDGFVGNDQDCDDSSFAINPNAEETFNGIDDDCDGVVDESFTAWYRDSDGDGFGYQDETINAVLQPAGYVATGNDCNDEDDSMYPGATEICDDGIDQDCDEGDLSCPDTKPSAPSNVSVVNITQSSAVITWDDNSDDENSFEIGVCTIEIRGQCSSSGWSPIATLPEGTTYYVLADLIPDTSYGRYYVMARNESGLTSSIGGVDFRTLGDTSKTLRVTNALNSSGGSNSIVSVRIASNLYDICPAYGPGFEYLSPDDYCGLGPLQISPGESMDFDVSGLPSEYYLYMSFGMFTWDCNNGYSQKKKLWTEWDWWGPISAVVVTQNSGLLEIRMSYFNGGTVGNIVGTDTVFDFYGVELSPLTGGGCYWFP